VNRPLIERIFIVAATFCGAILCVWWTNSIFPLMAIALVVYLVMIQQRTDNGEALREAANQTGEQRRTRRRDDE
jgi:hypothetical protein